MSDDRLKELLRQRALLAEHLAWLDREIAAAQPPKGTVATPMPADNPAIAGNAPAAGQPRLVQPAVSAPATDVDALFDRLQTEEKSRGQFSKQGCWLVFSILMLVSLVGIAALIFIRYR
ncbi:MAG TPA: hypothetical protein VGD88_14190 [Opitutaceae bacterium]